MRLDTSLQSMVVLLAAAVAAGAQTCPPVNFAQGASLSMFFPGPASVLARQLDGSFTIQQYKWNYAGRGLQLGARIGKVEHAEQGFGNCGGINRKFQTPAGWRPLAQHLGTMSTNPVGGDLLGDGTLAGIGSTVSNNNLAYLVFASPDATVRSKETLDVSNNTITYLFADFNGDNKQDLVGIKFGDGNQEKGGVAIYKGNGDGTFGAPAMFAAGNAGEGATAFDFNNDGKLDLAVASYRSGDVTILLGNGDATFKAPVSYKVGSQAYTVAVGDFNGDSKPDLVASTIDSASPVSIGKVVLLLGNGDGTFQAAKTILPGVTATGLATGDYDNDGRTDLVVTDSANDNVILMLGDGRGAFLASSVYQASYGTPFATDVDGDGNLDVVVGAGHPDGLTAHTSGLTKDSVSKCYSTPARM